MQDLQQWKIKSESIEGKYYTVIFDEITNDLICDCLAIGKCKHIVKVKMILDGKTEKQIKLLVSEPYLKSLRSDSSYRLEFDLIADAKQGIPQSEQIMELLSWKGCILELTIRLKKDDGKF